MTFPVRIRVWCDRHDVALAAVDGPPFGLADPKHPMGGVWVIDLSDMDCLAAGEDELCHDAWSITIVPPTLHP